jgi:hypothetical protein
LSTTIAAIHPLLEARISSISARKASAVRAAGLSRR